MMPNPGTPRDERRNRLLELLLGAQLVGVAALSLSAVGGSGRETSLEYGLAHVRVHSSRS